jgi:hypothetical protein
MPFRAADTAVVTAFGPPSFRLTATPGPSGCRPAALPGGKDEAEAVDKESHRAAGRHAQARATPLVGCADGKFREADELRGHARRQFVRTGGRE